MESEPISRLAPFGCMAEQKNAVERAKELFDERAVAVEKVTGKSQKDLAKEVEVVSLPNAVDDKPEEESEKN